MNTTLRHRNASTTKPLPHSAGQASVGSPRASACRLFIQGKSRADVAAATLQRQCACASTPGANAAFKACNSGKPRQPKLSIGASADPLEQEADRVAEQVLAAPAPAAISGAPMRIQRFTGSPRSETSTAPDSVDRVLAGSGRSLEPALQQDMEQRFGHDFSRVRVHSDGAAEQSARDVNANAYTVGHDIVFGEGRFAPETHEGQRLIAHELTHVVQQSFDRAPVVRRNDQEPVERIDVALVLDENADAMTQTYATTYGKSPDVRPRVVPPFVPWQSSYSSFSEDRGTEHKVGSHFARADLQFSCAERRPVKRTVRAHFLTYSY